jgi:hypothetical protein
MIRVVQIPQRCFVSRELMSRKGKGVSKEDALFASRSEPMTLDTFSFQAKRYRKLLREHIDYLDIYDRGGGDIPGWSDRWRRLLRIVKSLKEPVTEYRRLLEDPSQLPRPVVLHRSLLLATLQQADTHTKNLLTDLADLRACPQSSSERARKLRYAIQKNVTLLNQASQDTLLYTHELLDKIRF